MADRKKAVFNWSGGKDSALALQKILKEGEFEVIALLTTINADKSTSSIHAIPLKLLLKQAESIGIPLYTVPLSKDGSTYEDGMKAAIAHFKSKGVKHFIFGDIFLSDVKSYREKMLNPVGIEVVEPLWGKSSEEVMQDFLKSGISTMIIVTQAEKLDQSFIGKEINGDLLRTFPADIDVCGENGEYHTFAFKGDIFKTEICFEISDVSEITYDFKLDTGETQSCTYWQAELSDC